MQVPSELCLCGGKAGESFAVSPRAAEQLQQQPNPPGETLAGLDPACAWVRVACFRGGPHSIILFLAFRPHSVLGEGK